MRSKSWNEDIKKMPALTVEQRAAVEKILDYHCGWLVSDYPRCDEALYHVKQDLDEITKVKP